MNIQCQALHQSQQQKNCCLLKEIKEREETNQSISQEGEDTRHRGTSPRLPYGGIPDSHASGVSIQAPFPYQVNPSNRHRLAQ